MEDKSALADETRTALSELLSDRRPRRSEEVARSLRATVSRRHVAVAGAMLLVVCAVAGWFVLRARAVPVEPVSAPSLPAVAVAASPTPTARPSVTVHVVGAVGRPGLVVLPQGARVADAIAAAGGVRADADPGELNLAQPLADGAQIKVGTREEPGGELRAGASAAGAAGASAAGATLDLNTATAAQLEQLPGIGPVTAQKIVAWREKHGRFSRVEELQEVDGIGPKLYSQLAGAVRV